MVNTTATIYAIEMIWVERSKASKASQQKILRILKETFRRLEVEVEANVTVRVNVAMTCSVDIPVTIFFGFPRDDLYSLI